ncbi:MAG TPA: hypothetical protein VL383_15840 [Gemmatimonadaceae bacterium]|nr:hypothetical protein [Gemmatimonadaceae bacterium]
MSRTRRDVFTPEALDANRRGELTDAQLRGFRGLSRYRHKSAFGSAALLVAGAVLIGGFASPSASPTLRLLIPLVCLVIAAFLVVRAITGADALTHDLRRREVQFVEGAIGKSRVGGGRAPDVLYLDVDDKRFNVSPATYDAAPDAGYVRLYFLPRSRKIVNLEVLPNPAFENGVTPQDIARAATPQGMMQSFGAAIHSHSRRETNEARANLASVGDALQSMFAQPAPPAPGARDPRPLDEAIVGTWSNGLVTVAFLADGSVTADMLGRRERGRWSVDASGRLRAGVMGQEQAAEAWIAGDRLTISADGQGLTFARQQ